MFKLMVIFIDVIEVSWLFVWICH